MEKHTKSKWKRANLEARKHARRLAQVLRRVGYDGRDLTNEEKQIIVSNGWHRPGREKYLAAFVADHLTAPKMHIDPEYLEEFIAAGGEVRIADSSLAPFKKYEGK